MTSIKESIANAVDQKVAPLIQRIDRLTAVIEDLRAVTQPRLLTTDEAANVLKCCTATVRAHAKQGRILYTRRGNRLLFASEDLAQIADTPTAPPKKSAQKTNDLRAHTITH
jgi:excisionase family DNA binding protein